MIAKRALLTICSTVVLTGTMLPVLDASALEISRVRCEARGDRSKVDVDARGAAAGSTHSVTITSGANTNTAMQAQIADANGELDFRFDSNVNDENNLPSGFIQGSVTASIPDAQPVTAACRMRSR